MTREDAKQSIIRNAGSYLTRDNSKKGYICPICGSGSGKKGTGITTKDKIHFTCWAGCFTNSDIIDIINECEFDILVTGIRQEKSRGFKQHKKQLQMRV